MRAMSRRFAPLLVVALTAGITACGSSGSGSGPLASDSASTILSVATNNTLASSSFTISGGTDAKVSVDLTIVRGIGCTGTITQPTGKSKFIWIGKTAYAQTSSMPANEWMRGNSSAADLQGLTNLCRPAGYLAPLLNASGASSATKTNTVYQGQQALTLSIPGANGEPGTIIVTDTGIPLLLSVSEPDAGSFTFTRYDAATTIAPPKAA
jgi:hypothetical protein